MIFKLKSVIDEYPDGVIDEPGLLGGKYLANIFRGFGVRSSVFSEDEKSELVTEISASVRRFCFLASVFLAFWVLVFGSSVLPKLINTNGLSWIAVPILFLFLPTSLVHLQHRILIKRLMIQQ